MYNNTNMKSRKTLSNTQNLSTVLHCTIPVRRRRRPAAPSSRLATQALVQAETIGHQSRDLKPRRRSKHQPPPATRHAVVDTSQRFQCWGAIKHGFTDWPTFNDLEKASLQARWVTNESAGRIWQDRTGSTSSGSDLNTKKHDPAPEPVMAPDL